MLDAINTGEQMSSLLSEIARAACELLDFHMCSLLIADEREERLRVAGSYGLTSSYVDLVNGSRPILLLEQGPTYSSPSAQAFLTRSLVLIPDASRASEFSPWRDMARDEGYTSLIAAPLAHEGPALGVLVGYGRDARQFTSKQINELELLARFASTALITAQLRTRSRLAIDELNRTNSELVAHQRLMAEQDVQHDLLMRAVASNIGVAGVITTLAHLLRAPVCLQDSFGTLLADERLHLTDEDLTERNHFMLKKHDTLVNSVNPSRNIPEIRTTVRTIELDSEPGALLWIGPTRTGQASIPDQVLDRFAMAVALELAKARPLQQARTSMARDVVTRLVGGEGPAQRESAVTRALALGFDVRHEYQLALFQSLEPRSSESSVSLVEFLEARTSAASYPTLIGGDDRRAIALIQSSAPRTDELLAECLEQLKGMAPNVATNVVVATAGPEWPELSRLHRGLSGALALLPNSVTWSMTRVDLTSMTGLLLTHGSPEALCTFSATILGGLSAASDGPVLLQTLNVWLDSQVSLPEAASILHVHPNTVKYRLRKIERLLGKDFKVPDHVMEVRFALAIDGLARAQALSAKTEFGSET